MNRTLASALAAAVVGSTAGAIAATQLAGDGGGTPTATRSSGTTESPGDGEPATAAPDPALDGVLWANQRSLHDGDQEVAIHLIDRPAELHRTATGWLMTTMASPQEPSYEAWRVDADGSTIFLAETFGRGDVSRDGTRYAAMRDDGRGYGIWDTATGELVQTVRAPEAGWWPGGLASFSDDVATLLAEWRTDEEEPRVIATRLGSGEHRVVADDLVGASWNASPDGSWLAGISATESDPEAGVETCADIRSTADPSDRLVDCGSTFGGYPSFSPDGTRLLTVVPPLDGFGPALFRVLDSAERTMLGEVDAPDAVLEGKFLDDDEVLLLGARNLDGDGTVIYRCDLDGACDPVARAGDAAETAVLGDTN
ncbi:PD40 domain-containing protein [Nocardioides ferulae]|uniref:PD40 domain-containing protein n=1 Tax=Nocardioides ferulae TaxID=2340821 RepID=UPI000EB4F4BB|nr:PD40 domain-containing protein [Nocardioides ferulae]